MARKPKKVGSYVVHDVLGSGGMGEVYLGEHELLGREVAIKRLVCSDEKLKPDFEERFRREGRALANLHSEHIVDVYDLFSWRGDLYMVLEYVEGFDLGEVIKKVGLLPFDVALLIALRMCQALEHAHFHGIIHRDIKPANVMISKTGDVRLMDFGVARDESLPKVTKTGMIVGTPMYLAPETITGESADERSDLYALGATLYVMLTGRRLFEHATPENLYHLIAQGRFPRAGSVQPAIPRRVRRVLDRCLARKPDKRYPSASHLRVDLEKTLAWMGAWANGNERMVAFLHNEGHISEQEARTVINAESLVLTEGELQLKRSHDAVGRAVTAAFLLALAAAFGGAWVAGWLDPLIALVTGSGAGA